MPDDPAARKPSPEFRRTEYLGAVLVVLLLSALLLWIVTRNLSRVRQLPPADPPRLDLQAPGANPSVANAPGR